MNFKTILLFLGITLPILSMQNPTPSTTTTPPGLTLISKEGLEIKLSKPAALFCPMFANLLQSGMQETQSNCINLPDISTNIVTCIAQMLEFLNIAQLTQLPMEQQKQQLKRIMSTVSAGDLFIAIDFLLFDNNIKSLIKEVLVAQPKGKEKEISASQMQTLSTLAKQEFVSSGEMLDFGPEVDFECSITDLLKTPKVQIKKPSLLLDLSNCKLTSLRGLSAIKGIETIQRLKLNNNKLVSLPNGIFTCCPNLNGLFLSNNNLTTLNPNSFKGLKKLISLCLSNNKIDQLPDCFNELKMLLNVDLGGNKSLKEIPSSLLSLLASNDNPNTTREIILGNGKKIKIMTRQKFGSYSIH